MFSASLSNIIPKETQNLVNKLRYSQTLRKSPENTEDKIKISKKLSKNKISKSPK